MHFDPREQWASTEEGRNKLVGALMSTSVGSADNMGVSDPRDLPRRHLPPGNFSDMYRVYVAECYAANKPVAAATTFFRVLRTSGWKDKIRFRGTSTHAQCMTCHRLKSRIRHSKDLQSHAVNADRYMRHLGGVFADREVYNQTKCRAQHQRDLVNITVDSMDKSKFRLPRFASGRIPKLFENKQRPDLELTCAILHGRAIYVWVTDSTEQSCGSDWSLEVLSLSLDKAFTLAQRKHEPWPSHLRIWTDNTPKEIHGTWGYKVSKHSTVDVKQIHFTLYVSLHLLFGCSLQGVSQLYHGMLDVQYGDHSGIRVRGPRVDDRWPYAQ